MTNYLFISYARKDWTHFYLYNFLNEMNNEGFYLWFDKDLKVGEYWHASLMEKIAQSAGLIFIATQNSVGSVHCREEWEYASGRGIPVYPLMLEDCQLPPGLVEIQWLRANIQYDYQHTENGGHQFVNQERTGKRLATDLARKLGQQHPAYSQDLHEYSTAMKSFALFTDALASMAHQNGLIGLAKKVYFSGKIKRTEENMAWASNKAAERRELIDRKYTAFGILSPL